MCLSKMLSDLGGLNVMFHYNKVSEISHELHSVGGYLGKIRKYALSRSVSLGTGIEISKVSSHFKFSFSVFFFCRLRCEFSATT